MHIALAVGEEDRCTVLGDDGTGVLVDRFEPFVFPFHGSVCFDGVNIVCSGGDIIDITAYRIDGGRCAAGLIRSGIELPFLSAACCIERVEFASLAVGGCVNSGFVDRKDGGGIAESLRGYSPVVVIEQIRFHAQTQLPVHFFPVHGGGDGDRDIYGGIVGYGQVIHFYRRGDFGPFFNYFFLSLFPRPFYSLGHSPYRSVESQGDALAGNYGCLVDRMWVARRKRLF